jgi:hypothetical protein
MRAYFSRVWEVSQLFIKSFKRGYVPLKSHCAEKRPLASVIAECSDRGKLLILHLTLHEKSVQLPLQLSDEDYLIYVAPFNSAAAYDVSRTYPIDSLPFLGVFFCPSKSPNEAQFIDRVQTLDDRARIPRHFLRYQAQLHDRRSYFVAHQMDHSLRTEQDDEFQAVIREQKAQEAAKRREAEIAAQKQEIKQTRIHTALQRHNSVPVVSPSANPNDVIALRFVVKDKEPKVRQFLKTDSVQTLYDYIGVETAPKQPILKIGMPVRVLSEQDMGKSLAEIKLARKDTIWVHSDDSDSD